MCKLTYAGLTDRGLHRSQNEDNWFANAKQGLFIVSDGMGGHISGAEASRLVVDRLPPMLHASMEKVEDLAGDEARERIESTLQELSRQMRAASRHRVIWEIMGATVVLAVVRKQQALIAHMGDSRAYLFRQERLEQLTSDHSVIQYLLDTGEIGFEEACVHPARGQITRFVGILGDPPPDVTHLTLRPGDRLLLCTDGLTGLLPDHQIASMLESKSTPEIICLRLVQAANDAGGYDNITALLVQCDK